MRKLQESGIFNIDEPIGLLYGAWLYITLHFCRRGREVQRELRPDSFVVMHDDRNHPYLTMTHVKVSKSHQGGVKEDDTFESEARLYESNDHNGFALVKKYLDKIHKDLPVLYQYPRKTATETDRIWYERSHSASIN